MVLSCQSVNQHQKHKKITNNQQLKLKKNIYKSKLHTRFLKKKNKLEEK